LVPASTGAREKVRSDKTGSDKTGYASSAEPMAGTDSAMTDETGKRERKDSREDRLKSALRENLKRRKAQARERTRTVEPRPTSDETSLHGQVGKHGD
jgi:hypothetical protein